jgi:intron-binding protein aquarius
MHHSRATMLQKMAHRHYPRELQSVIYAGVGLLCAGQQKHSYLERAFVGFSDDNLEKLLYKMCLLQENDDKLMTRDFMLQVLADYLSIPPYPMDQLRAFPLYPTKSMLWDHSVIPPSSSQLRVSQVLAVPKLNSKFLSFQDYLLRNFELVRLESAYEIRSDLVNVVKRVRPLLRQSALDESEDIELKTEFAGWSRMALEIDKPLSIKEVQPPELGQTVSAQVTAEVVIDLERCGDAIRKEWDEIGEYDNIFLVAIDASKMSGNSAPLLKDYHLRHGAHKMWDSDDAQRRVPDEEDSTFPERFGITMVRGCMVLNVRNEAGTMLSDPGVEVPEGEKGKTKRIYKVAMDSAQYVLDKSSANGTESYKVSESFRRQKNGQGRDQPILSSLTQQFNLVVKRHGRENNFKSVLETIRGLMEGAGSIERVIPPWLQVLVLGSGDPTSASYKSPSMKEYAMTTVGVNKPSDYLDFGDTFLDEAHLRDSFDGEIIVDRNKSEKEKNADQPRSNYKIRMTEEADGKSKTVINGVCLPFPKGVTGNAIRFTPLQVEAIHSGLSPGLTMVVGPPGTGE